MDAILPKLLARLYRAASTDPDAFVAMRITHPNGGAWTIANAVMMLLPAGAPSPTTINLTTHTLRSLAVALGDAGWSVTDLDAAQRDRGAACLISTATTSAQTPGSALLGHDNPVWPLMGAYALELAAASEVAASVGRQLSINTAEGLWLDVLGTYYGVPRVLAETDANYGPRMLREVVQPKTNNVAMAAIIEEATGRGCVVSDVTIYGPSVPLYDGAVVHDGVYFHDSAALPIYGLFDVRIAAPAPGVTPADPTALTAQITALVSRLRAAGTLLRQVIIAT